MLAYNELRRRTGERDRSLREKAMSLEEATAQLKTVTPEWYDVAKAFFG